MPEAIANVCEIAESCLWNWIWAILFFRFYPPAAGASMDSRIYAPGGKGLEKQLEKHPERDKIDAEAYRKRLQYELGVIRGNGFSGTIFSLCRNLSTGPGSWRSCRPWARFGSRLPCGPGPSGSLNPIRCPIICFRALPEYRARLPCPISTSIFANAEGGRSSTTWLTAHGAGSVASDHHLRHNEGQKAWCAMWDAPGHELCRNRQDSQACARQPEK